MGQAPPSRSMKRGASPATPPSGSRTTSTFSVCPCPKWVHQAWSHSHVRKTFGRTDASTSRFQSSRSAASAPASRRVSTVSPLIRAPARSPAPPRTRCASSPSPGGSGRPARAAARDERRADALDPERYVVEQEVDDVAQGGHPVDPRRPLRDFEIGAVQGQRAAVRHGQRLVEAKDTDVPEAPERALGDRAEEPEGAV